MSTALSLMAAAVVLATGSLLLILRELHLRSLTLRVSKAVVGEAGRSEPLGDAVEWLSIIGRRYRRFYSPENLEQLRTIVQSAGFNPYRTVPILIGGKTVSMFLIPFAVFIIAEFSGAPFSSVLVYTAFGALATGIMAPRLVLAFIGRRFNAAVVRGTPDAIDLLVVCSEAGMGLESALEHVSKEIARSNPPMSKVLFALLDDLRVLSRHDAFENLAQRSTADGLRRLGTMINQSLQYGTPLSQTLRAIAEELRRDRLIKLEERVQVGSEALTIPMVMFMLPAMFVILGGSPYLHLMGAFSQFHQGAPH